jgi:hypothetical protein
LHFAARSHFDDTVGGSARYRPNAPWFIFNGDFRVPPPLTVHGAALHFAADHRGPKRLWRRLRRLSPPQWGHLRAVTRTRRGT